MGAPRYGDPYGSDEGLPLFTGETPAPPSAPPAPVRVGGKVRPPRLVHIVEPDYPNFLRQARIEGSVVLEAVINASGRIVQLTVVRSDHPLLTGAARRAVEQWIYEPTYLNDQPVPVLLTITVEFRLKK
jgi:protein TonB